MRQPCSAQCSIETGPAPSNAYFNTADQTVPGGLDNKWMIATEYNGSYKPAVVMSGLPSVFYNNSSWISFSQSGEHTGDKYFFYKIDFDLPCFNVCHKSFSQDSAFCLNLDLYSDNSIYEIFVNDIPQSGNLNGSIPLSNPFNPIGHTPSDKTAVTLCTNWKGGKNTIIIQVASSATIAGLMVDGSKDKTHSDTTVVKICEGESYLGHSKQGLYSENYIASNGCDSVRLIQLIVQEKPKPNLGRDKFICEGDSLTLTPGLFTSYSWQDGTTREKKVIYQPGTYAVTVANTCGSARDEVVVKGGSCDVYFPTAFTPNNDGKNDRFKILSDLSFRQYHLLVYNRWGQKLFETTDPLQGWDGYWKGKKQPTGFYIWYCTFTRSTSESKAKGAVLLMY